MLEIRGKHPCFTVTLLQVVAWHKGWELGNAATFRWLQHAMGEKRSATKHELLTSVQGLTSDRMSWVAGVESTWGRTPGNVYEGSRSSSVEGVAGQP